MPDADTNGGFRVAAGDGTHTGRAVQGLRREDWLVERPRFPVKRLHALSLLFALALLGSPLEAQDPPRRLRVLQWNVGTLNPWAMRLPDSAIPRLVDTIAAATADAVTLQEVRSTAQVERVVRALATRGLTFHAHSLIVDVKHPDGLSVILHRVPAGARPACDRRTLLTSAGIACQSLALGPLSIVSIHGPVDGPAKRRAYFDEVLAWTRRELPGRCVLSGDWNVGPHGGVGLAAILPWQRRVDAATYRRIMTAFPAHSTVGPTTAYALRVDHVAGRGVRVVSQQVLRGKRQLPQDHDPVLVELEVE